MTLLPILLALAPVQDDPVPVKPVEPEKKEKWVALFNGKDLDGWTPKFVGHDLGVNLNDTFRVEEGLLRVTYEDWEEDFGGRFGHLFFDAPFSHYRLRCEYRFVGEQVPGGPGWAFRNSGVMLHGQDPKTMTKGQDFPVSIEAQLLGGNGKNDRTTGNLCTPGTHVVMKDKLTKRHCINSTSETFHGDGWVWFEVEVKGHEFIRHKVNGELVLEYQAPQLDDGDADAKRLLAAGAEVNLSSGSISLQAESHGLDFRKVEILDLTEEDE